jgi:hypothetical protein
LFIKNYGGEREIANELVNKKQKVESKKPAQPSVG